MLPGGWRAVMTFLNLSLLGGTALVALPIVLHLVMRRKPRWVEFPALRFVQPRHQTNQRQLRLRHLLLLALRMALIALVAFALARPRMKAAGGALGSQRAPVAAALVFDTSRRMEYRHENRTRLEVAQELAGWLLSQFPPESQVGVLAGPEAASAFQVDLGAARYRIQRLETTAQAPSLPSLIEQAARLLAQSDLERKEIFVFTDLARPAWPAQAAQQIPESLQKIPEGGVYLIDVGIASPVNVALGDLRLSGQIVSNRSTFRIETELRSAGFEGARAVELFLLEADAAASSPGQRKPQKIGEQTITLQPGQAQPVELRTSGLGLGTHQGYVQVLGSDGLAADDRRYFTVEARPAWRVLLVAPKPAASYGVFLAQALAPESFRRTGQAWFEPTLLAQDDLAGTDLEPFAAIFLLDPGPLPPAVWQKLADYVAEGHGLGVFLGRNAQPVASFNEGPAQEVLAGKLLRQARAPDDDLTLDPRNLDHPVLAEFRKVAQVPWFRHPIYRYWQLGPLPGGVHVIAPFRDGSPAILERVLGRGRAVTMTTPISDDPNRSPWNLLPVNEPWPFVILSNALAGYLVGSGTQELNYTAGQTAVLQLNPDHPFKTYVLTAPDGTEFRLTPDLKQHRLLVTSTDQVGNYRVQAGGTAEGVDRGFSVNLAAEQTRLDRIPDAELAAWFGPLPFRLARNKEQIELDVSTGRVGRELFPLLILTAALVMALEQAVANRFYGHERQGT